jgi:hypothetical protein
MQYFIKRHARLASTIMGGLLAALLARAPVSAQVFVAPAPAIVGPSVVATLAPGVVVYGGTVGAGVFGMPLAVAPTYVPTGYVQPVVSTAYAPALGYVAAPAVAPVQTYAAPAYVAPAVSYAAPAAYAAPVYQTAYAAPVYPTTAYTAPVYPSYTTSSDALWGVAALSVLAALVAGNNGAAVPTPYLGYTGAVPYTYPMAAPYGVSTGYAPPYYAPPYPSLYGGVYPSVYTPAYPYGVASVGPYIAGTSLAYMPTAGGGVVVNPPVATVGTTTIVRHITIFRRTPVTVVNRPIARPLPARFAGVRTAPRVAAFRFAARGTAFRPAPRLTAVRSGTPRMAAFHPVSHMAAFRPAPRMAAFHPVAHMAAFRPAAPRMAAFRPAPSARFAPAAGGRASAGRASGGRGRGR